MDIEKATDIIQDLIKHDKLTYKLLGESQASEYTRLVCDTYFSKLKIKCDVASNAYQGADVIRTDDTYVQYIIIFNDQNKQFFAYNDKTPEGIHPDLISAHILQLHMPQLDLQVIIDEETGATRMIAKNDGRTLVVADDNRDPDNRILKITK